MQVQSLGGEDSLEDGMATHSSILSWRIPWTEEPGSPQGCKELGTTEVTYQAHAKQVTLKLNDLKQQEFIFSYNSVGWLGRFSTGFNWAHRSDCREDSLLASTGLTGVTVFGWCGVQLSWKKLDGFILQSGNWCFRWMSSGTLWFTSMQTLTFHRLDWQSTWWSQGCNPRAQSQRMQGLLRLGLGSCIASLRLTFYWSKLSQAQPDSSSTVREINSTSWWLSGKESACQCRRHKRGGFNPWVSKIPWRRKLQPTPGFLPGKSEGQRSLEGDSPWGHNAESD